MLKYKHMSTIYVLFLNIIYLSESTRYTRLLILHK